MARIGNRYVQAPGHGGGLSNAAHRLVVAHSLECDAREGLAYDLAVGYIPNAGVSPHTLSDPGETVGVCDTDVVGYHVGPRANGISTGGEVTGRAAWTREQWLSGNANKALQRQAKALAEQAMSKGFGPGDYRWLSLGEVGDGRTQGFCYHYDVSRAIGGSDHWDPGTGYPADIQMSRIRWYAGVQDYWGEDIGSKPDDVVGSGPGGAQANWWRKWFAA